MPPTVAILNQKGGVGKTTVTLGLASAAAEAGDRVLVIDLDPQASSSWTLGVEPDATAVTVGDVLDKTPLADAIVASGWSTRIDVVPASGAVQQYDASGKPRRLARALARADGAVEGRPHDAVLIDCPPSLGNLTRNALIAAHHALLVVEPSALGLRGLGAVADEIDGVWDDHNPDLELAGVILNRVPAVSAEAARRIDELGRIVGTATIWEPAVPQRVILNQAIAERRPIHSYGSRARDPIRVFDALWARLRRAVSA